MIRRLVATQFDRLMSSGRTSPLLCRCADASERLSWDYVVKLRGSLDRGEEGMVSELLASRLATHFGILVPEPVLVEVSTAFAELVAMRQPRIAGKIRNSVGLSFGSELLTGVSTWLIDRTIPEAMWESAVHVFAFDALIQNPDRRYHNPNLLTRGDDMFVYDHEAAFSFLLDIHPSPTPWILDRETYLREHVFFKRLRSKRIDMAGFRDNLVLLTDDTLAEIRAEVPGDWVGPGLAKIEAHLRAMREHADEFVAAVARRLE